MKDFSLLGRFISYKENDRKQYREARSIAYLDSKAVPSLEARESNDISRMMYFNAAFTKNL